MIELNENDIKGKKYQALINSANHKCDSVSLVFERGEDGYIHESIFQMVACDLIKTYQFHYILIQELIFLTVSYYISNAGIILNLCY